MWCGAVRGALPPCEDACTWRGGGGGGRGRCTQRIDALKGQGRVGSRGAALPCVAVWLRWGRAIVDVETGLMCVAEGLGKEATCLEAAGAPVWRDLGPVVGWRRRPPEGCRWNARASCPPPCLRAFSSWPARPPVGEAPGTRRGRPGPGGLQGCRIAPAPGLGGHAWRWRLRGVHARRARLRTHAHTCHRCGLAAGWLTYLGTWWNLAESAQRVWDGGGALLM